jgi:hypothetical protein
MPLRFTRRVTLIPGLRVNFSKSGASLSIGHRGLWYTVGPKGQRATIGLPSSGLYWTKTYPPAAHGRHAELPKIIPHERPASPPTRREQAAFIVVIVVLVLVALAIAAPSLSCASAATSITIKVPCRTDGPQTLVDSRYLPDGWENLHTLVSVDRCKALDTGEPKPCFSNSSTRRARASRASNGTTPFETS